MINLFVMVLNMSLISAYAIVAILFARLILRNSSKKILYLLWAAVGFRLAFPFSIESPLSFMPFTFQSFSTEITNTPMTYGEGSFATMIFPGDILQTVLLVASFVWLTGVVFMLGRGIYTFVILKRKLSLVTRLEENIYVSDKLKTPFVMGIFFPKIYLPAHLSTLEQKYIILHEQTHVKRGDHLAKYAAYFLLSVHWFNPLVWVAFSLMNKDMEMACDESVISKLGGGTEIKKDYSFALLTLATQNPVINGITPAFNNSNLNPRVKNVLNYKRQSYLVLAISIVFVLVLGVGLSVDRVGSYAIDYVVSEDSATESSFAVLCCD